MASTTWLSESSGLGPNRSVISSETSATGHTFAAAARKCTLSSGHFSR
ncbi:hypothetical protein EDD35_1295 [Amycolatopsis thermoflava]|uniref:Uncharacterized protein n=1 Tax=Amycolatopsis thermoflava TaxID=84480 RepID=A0A3N2GQW9_9PSEU|nr:hypothetical protein EDD35_1295 [Amycolatopsis thermoflava]